jgi:molecular chaperone DnaK (HSP70)
MGEKITGAVITCPAYFKDPQREATKEAGQLAGINVLRVVNEPTAAAYAYGAAQKDKDKKNLFLVYDLGGGTFDVTVVSMIGRNLEVIGTGGDPMLGGGNFDDRIVDWMMEYIEKVPDYASKLTGERRSALRMSLKSYAEEAKKMLCGPPARNEYQFQIPSVGKLDGRPIPFSETLTMEKFNELISGLVKSSLEWIETAMKVPKEKHHYTEEDITEILLVGGSTRVPRVREDLKEKFPNTPIRGVEAGIYPDEIVAIGAGIIASEIDPDNDEVSKNKLIDVTGHTLSVEYFDEAKDKSLLKEIIKKETSIPTGETYQFASSGSYTTAARIKVWQGENEGEDINPEKVTMIGEFEMPLDPVKERIPLAIGLDLDKNGILIAHATNLLSGQQIKCELNYNDSAKMSPEELEKRKKSLESQMQAGVGATANPLDEKVSTGQTGAGGASRASQSGTTFQARQLAASTVTDVRAMMNPIFRALYDRAINSYANIPGDLQQQVMNMVIEIENAAKIGDQAKLMSFYNPLSQLLKGVN